MKIRNFVAYISLAFSTAAIITTIHQQKYNEAIFEKQQNKVTLLEREIDELKEENMELQQQMNNISLESILGNLEKDIEREIEHTNISINYIEEKESLNIDAESKENSREYELSDEFYYKLNQLIVCGNVRDLFLYGLGDEIDFSRINTVDIKKLSFYSCNESLDCSSFTQKYDSISFFNTSEIVAMNVLKDCDYSNTTVRCSNIYDLSLDKSFDTYMDIGQFAFFLKENNIHLKELDVNQWAYMDNSIALTDEEINALSQVNTNILSITSVGSDEPIDLNLTLNPNIQEFHLELPDVVYSWVDHIVPRNLRNIQIESNNPDLYIDFISGTVTEDTCFHLPSASTVRLKELDYNDVTPFYDLENVQMIVYEHSDILQTFNYDEKVYITYNANIDLFSDFINNMLDSKNNPKKIYKSE